MNTDTVVSALAGQDSGASLASLVAQVLRLLGEDPAREGLAATPDRVAQSWQFLTSGYQIGRASCR